MPYRDFRAEAAERARESEPIVFTLPGCDTDLRAIPVLAFGVLEDIAVSPELTENESAAVSAIRRFFEAVVVPDHLDALKVGLRAADPQTLRDVMQWLVEEYSGRPTSPPSASDNGQSADAASSTSSPDERDLAPSLP